MNLYFYQITFNYIYHLISLLVLDLKTSAQTNLNLSFFYVFINIYRF
jgi:hypothetical protein